MPESMMIEESPEGKYSSYLNLLHIAIYPVSRTPHLCFGGEVIWLAVVNKHHYMHHENKPLLAS